MKKQYLGFSLTLCVFLVFCYYQAENVQEESLSIRVPYLDPSALNEDQVEAIVERISEISIGLPPKLEEPHYDPNAAAIVSLKTRATPYLIAKLIDDSTTPLFERESVCCIGDLAHRFLCEIYSKDFLWLYQRNQINGSIPLTPTNFAGHGRPWIKNYQDLVNSEGGRRILQELWKKEIDRIEKLKQEKNNVFK